MDLLYKILIGILLFMLLGFFLVYKAVKNTPPPKPKKQKKSPIEEFNLQVGEEVNLWPKPGCYEVHAFAKGTHGGNGRLAIFNSKKIYKKVEEGEVYGKITMIKNNELKIEIFEYDD